MNVTCMFLHACPIFCMHVKHACLHACKNMLFLHACKKVHIYMLVKKIYMHVSKHACPILRALFV